MDRSKTHVVILAGGSGVRFWPLSRRERPKQLLSLFGDKPLVAETVERFAGRVPWENVWVVTTEGLRASIEEALPALARDQVLAEPSARNTAPSIAFAAEVIRRRRGHADAVLGVFPADHFLRDLDAFREAMEIAVARAAGGDIVTIGIEATQPETGYGYIQADALDEDGSAAVRSFVEKPSREKALSFLREGSYTWNSGMFFFRIDRLQEELARQMPALSQRLDAAVDAWEAGEEGAAEAYAALPATSFDVGVMEGARGVRVVPGRFGWSDVGHWDALPQVHETDASGNVVMGDVVAIDCSDSVLVGHDSRVLAAVGLQRLVVVDTEDALLVAPRERAQEVRRVVDALRARQHGAT